MTPKQRAKILDAAMHHKNIKTPELSKISGAKEPFIYDVLSAKLSSPSVVTLSLLADALDIELIHLVDADDMSKYN